MKKILFISNISNKITNFAIPSITAAQSLGFEFHMAANYSNFKDNSSHYNVTLHHIDLDRNPISYKNIKAYKQMMALIKKEKYDVIHCNTPVGGLLGRLCGKRANVPHVIYTAHGFHFYKGAPFINQFMFKRIEEYLARFTDALITINSEDYHAAKHFHLRSNGNVYYIPGVGVNTEDFFVNNMDKKKLKKSLGLEEDAFICVAMGDLIPRKNYKTSIEAISKTENRKINFLICGEGPLLSELKDFAKEKGVEKQIHFLGFRSDITQILNISDIFLFTTLQEGLPRSMMEAMAAGLPCVASKIRGNTDLIEQGEGGYLVNVKDSEGFAKAIEKIVNDSELQKEMRKKNLMNAKKYDVMNIKFEMKKIYEKEFGNY